MAKITYILDTSVYLSDANSIHSFGRNDIVVPLVILEEIDNNKKRQDGAGFNARNTIRIFDDLRTKGNLHKGVRIAKGKGILRARGYDTNFVPNDFTGNSADNMIIATALAEKNDGKKVVVVTKDINMRVKCDALQVDSIDYSIDQVVTNSDELYTGFKQHLVDDQVIDQFYGEEDVFISEEEGEFHPNQFIMLVSNQREKKTALAKFDSYTTPLEKILDYKSGVWGLIPRNKEQSFALNLLTDKEVPIVSIVGKAGSGKTLLAIGSALEQVLEEKAYSKVVVSRPIQSVGKDIGFLPGTMEEKMMPWLMPIRDNLEFLIGDNKTTMDMLFENGTIEIEALSYIRGRSISNAFIIIDEVQNLNIHELKTIITRVGENSKIVLTGDVEQIDNVYVDTLSNGLSYAVEKFKTHNLAGHITLVKGERSKVATLAAKVL